MVTIQDGCHHQVKWEWMSLSQIELVWVRVRVEWECFWVNLREDNKVFESKMAVAESNMPEFKMAAIIKLGDNEWVKFFVQNVWIQDGKMAPSSGWVRMNEWSFLLFKMFESQMTEFKMAEFKMAAIIKMSQNVWVKFFCAKLAESKMAEFKRHDCHLQVESEWISLKSEFCCSKWLNPRWQNTRWLPSTSWVRKNEFESDWISLSQSQSGVRVFLSESERR